MRHCGVLVGILLLWAALPAWAAEPSPILVSYSWDDGNTETGPDTFWVSRKARGNVALSSAFRMSGDQSVEIRDAAGDGDFPELQGYFPGRRAGWLVVHFALLVTNPQEELNIALAGPRGFGMARDAIAFWLFTKDGVLLHRTGGSAERLVSLKPFTWYGIDTDYDVARGRYALRIFEEGIERPVVSLKDQANVTSEPGSEVSMFSFIGDLNDRSNVAYYLDDVVVASTHEARLPPFVAPGRRQFLADARPSPRRQAGEPDAVRLEREGDTAFRRRSLPEAERLYEAALRIAKNPGDLLLKLSDVAFLRGDLAAEKSLREQIFGSLDPR